MIAELSTAISAGTRASGSPGALQGAAQAEEGGKLAPAAAPGGLGGLGGVGGAGGNDKTDLPAVQRVQPSSESEKPKRAGDEELSEEEQKQVQELKQRDREVRAHEEAHARVGGSYASAPSYEYVTGPDGKRYAVGGEVQIDASPVRGNPEATVRKMDIVIRAALAPADPSSQDMQVARKAQAQRAQAQAELLKQREDELVNGQGASEEDENTVRTLMQANQAYGESEARANAEKIAAELFEAQAAIGLTA